MTPFRGSSTGATADLVDELRRHLVDAEVALTESNRHLIDAEVAIVQAERRARAAEVNEKRLTNDADNWERRARFAERLLGEMRAMACDACRHDMASILPLTALDE